MVMGGTTIMDFHCSGSWPAWMASVEKESHFLPQSSSPLAAARLADMIRLFFWYIFLQDVKEVKSKK